MKNVLLLIICIGLSYEGYTQRTVGGYFTAPPGSAGSGLKSCYGGTERTTSIGGTDTLRNTSDTATPAIYIAGILDSGYTSGMNAYGDIGYAERYDFNGADSTLIVKGVMTLFGGAVNPASLNTVNFYTWGVGPVTALRTYVSESGYPNAVFSSVVVPFPLLGIATSPTAHDTFKVFNFTSPTSYLEASFFVGYQMTYNFSTPTGDTIALFSTLDGERASSVFLSTDSTDTIINNQNTVLYNDGTGWHDYATGDFGLQVDFFIFPIVEVYPGDPEKASSITNKNLTFFGNYPNPANSSTSVKFSLAVNADVTLIITDINGQVLNTINKTDVPAGVNTMPIETGNMAPGNYLYMIRNSAGGGIAGEFTVVH